MKNTYALRYQLLLYSELHKCKKCPLIEQLIIALNPLTNKDKENVFSIQLLFSFITILLLPYIFWIHAIVQLTLTIFKFINLLNKQCYFLI